MVRFQNLVDGPLLQAIGGRQNVLEQFPQALSELVECLQQRQLVDNWDKTGYMTSSAELGSELNERWSLGHEQKLRIRCLGTDATDGAPRGVQEQNKRLAKASSVSKRVFFRSGRQELVSAL
eukprot:8923684-Pyramimonas_sp.AAC.1